VAVRGEHLVEALPLVRDLLVRAVRVHQHRVAALRRPLDRLERRRADPHRRMRLLERLGQDLDVVEVHEAAVEAGALLPPGRQHRLEVLAELRVAVLGRDAEDLVLARIEAAPCAPVHAPAREHVEQRHLLGDAQRVSERGQGHRGADAQAPRARRHVRPHQVHVRADAVAGEVVLREPDRVEARALHDVDPRQRALVHARERHLAVGPAEELQRAELHGRIIGEIAKTTRSLESRTLHA